MIQEINIADTTININPKTISPSRIIRPGTYGFQITPNFEIGDNYMTVVGKNPITIEIKCFVTTPPPPGYKPCPECGTFITSSGHRRLLPHTITDFHESDSLHIMIKDGDDEVVEISARTRRFLKK